MINVDTYPYLAFSYLTYYLEETGIGFFWLHCLPEIYKTKFGSSNQETFPSTSKNSGIVLVPCCACNCFPTAIPSGVDIPDCHFLWQASSFWGSQLLQGAVSHKLMACCFCFLHLISKVCKSDHFESCNSVKLSFTNIWVLHSNFVGCESFLESFSFLIFLLYMRQTCHIQGLAVFLFYLRQTFHKGYLRTWCFCCCYWIFWVDPGCKRFNFHLKQVKVHRTFYFGAKVSMDIYLTCRCHQSKQ